MSLKQKWYKNVLELFGKDYSRRRLIFSINSGRSGSQYLAELMNTAAEVSAFHEAEPYMNGVFLQLANRSSYCDTIDQRRPKAKGIRRALSRMAPEQVYCETNHMFIKTFFDVIAEEFSNFEVIILRRDLANVLKSFVELGYFSGKNSAWPDWMTSPNAKTAAIKCIAGDDDLDQYDLCIAYLVDIEARAHRFRKDYPWVRTHEVRLEGLNEYSGVEALFRDLRISMTDATRTFLGQKINSRAKAKEAYHSPSDLDYCRMRIARYREKAASLGIAIPDTLALG